MAVLKINADDGLEEANEAVDGDPGVIEALGTFNNDGPTLVDEVSMGGNCVQRTEPVEKLVQVVRWVVDHWVNITSGGCRANSSAVSGFYWDYFSVSTHLRTAALIWGE